MYIKRTLNIILLLLVVMALASCSKNKIKPQVAEYLDYEKVLEATGVYGTMEYEYNISRSMDVDKMEIWVDYYKNGVLQDHPIKYTEVINSGDKESIFITVTPHFQGVYMQGEIFHEVTRLGDVINVKTKSTVACSDFLSSESYLDKYAKMYFAESDIDIVLDKPISLGIVVKDGATRSITEGGMKAVVRNEGSIEDYLTENQSVYIFKVKFTK